MCNVIIWCVFNANFRQIIVDILRQGAEIHWHNPNTVLIPILSYRGQRYAVVLLSILRDWNWTIFIIWSKEKNLGRKCSISEYILTFKGSCSYKAHWSHILRTLLRKCIMICLMRNWRIWPINAGCRKDVKTDLGIDSRMFIQHI